MYGNMSKGSSTLAVLFLLGGEEMYDDSRKALLGIGFVAGLLFLSGVFAGAVLGGIGAAAAMW